MVLRIVSLVLWLVLGMMYFLIYLNGTNSCCNSSNVEEVNPIVINDTVYQETDRNQRPIGLLLNERGIPDHGVIYFDENSTNFNASETLLQYLRNISQLSSENIFEIQLIGTQSRKEEQVELDKERCIAIQNVLIDLGVDEKNISIDPRGNIDSKAHLDKDNLRLDQRVEIRIKDKK